MIEFFTRLFKRETSGTTAKERLRLVLLSDHLALAPDVVAAMKADLLEVISRYVDIDPAHSDVTFEQQDRTIAMLANVPILGLKAREHPGARVTSPAAAPQLASVPGGQTGTATAFEPHRNGASPGVSEAVTALDELRAAEAPSVSTARPAAERTNGAATATPMLPLEPRPAADDPLVADAAGADPLVADAARDPLVADVAGDDDAHDVFAAQGASAALDVAAPHDASTEANDAATADAVTAHDTAAQPVDLAAMAAQPDAAEAAGGAVAAAGKPAPKAAGAKPRARRRRRRAAAKPSPAAG